MEIYLDNAATTKISDEVLEEMLPYLKEFYGNASSVYSIGKKSKEAITLSRDLIAKKLNCKSKEIFFTSGGSEADNWAIKGSKLKSKHIISTPIEHEAVLETLDYMKSQGYEIEFLDVDKDGIVKIGSLKEKLRDDTALVSVMYANNEIGTIQPIEEIGEILKNTDTLFHVDAVQALGAIKIDLKKLNVDMMSFSAHKIHGPKGVGALYIKDGTKINSLINGGSQERNKRAGTENVAGIVGFAKAVEIAQENVAERNKEIRNLRDNLLRELLKIDGVYLNGSIEKRLPGNINVSIDGIDSNILLMNLDMEGVMASIGSACNSGSINPSYVLKVIGRDDTLSKNSLRLTLNEENSQEQISQASAIIIESINSLR
ncbi:cysteine desulfurase [Peptoniphilus asaccharolyticus DSM 20463]|uniref:cysteine desulfurase n=1 Tax=Peptoniphilus asaccharolyticus DSM 20463 TaxID=573058 RepID=A0A1W1UP65_PEPAS|nr:cysteine desulfurase family protein [Peptoniphilus asaccharolyticus]MBL7574987.1 cysteine desulfurase [Peptoniphilus asaccharolyticus]SMB82918.1 cysteine desulfurase [Peptoniphilus asaccharolyticus DSM 20463]